MTITDLIIYLQQIKEQQGNIDVKISCEECCTSYSIEDIEYQKATCCTEEDRVVIKTGEDTNPLRVCKWN